MSPTTALRAAGRPAGSARGIAAALAAAVCLGVGAATALAHTEVESSSPRDGSTLSRLPARVVLTFEQPISRVRLVVVKRNGKGNFAKTFEQDPRDARRVLVTLKRPGVKWRAGRYRVNWLITATDGDAVNGVLAFRVVR
jgi:methionine-rich copper-binding protein CopC